MADTYNMTTQRFTLTLIVDEAPIEGQQIFDTATEAVQAGEAAIDRGQCDDYEIN